MPLTSAPPVSAQRSEQAALVDQQAVAAGTALRPVAPCRLFDARQTPDAGRIDATTVRIQVTGRCGVPTEATAAAISLVATNVTAPGFLTVWGGPSVRPEASNLNFVRGNTVANSAVVQLSGAGTIDVYTSVPADVIVDVTAVFAPAPGPVASGRFMASAPQRLLDTRSIGARGTGELRVPLPPGVAPDAVALAVSVTAVDAAAPGFLTAYPAGTSRPDVSVVNTDRFNTTRANALFVPVTPDGIAVFRSMDTDVIVDLWGWFTGPSAASSTDGLFVPQSPSRVWDSRGSLDPLNAGGTVEKVATPPNAAAVVLNLTAVEPTRPGFMSVYAAGTALPNVSSLNYRWRQPVAALTVSAVSNRGLAVYSVRRIPRPHRRGGLVHRRSGCRHGAAATESRPARQHRGDLHLRFVVRRDPVEWWAAVPAGRRVRQSPRVVPTPVQHVVSRARGVRATHGSRGAGMGDSGSIPHRRDRDRVQRLGEPVPDEASTR